MANDVNELELYEGIPVIEASNNALLRKKLAEMDVYPEKFAVKISQRSTIIKDYAFRACCIISKNMAAIIIPDSIVAIGKKAFEDCIGLVSINIPMNVVTIGEKAFYGCANLTNITVSERNKVYDSREECNAIIETATNKLMLGCAGTNIPKGIIEIGSSAFAHCSALMSIHIPDSVTKIGDATFMGCHNLTSIILPEGITEVEGSVFADCI